MLDVIEPDPSEVGFDRLADEDPLLPPLEESERREDEEKPTPELMGDATPLAGAPLKDGLGRLVDLEAEPDSKVLVEEDLDADEEEDESPLVEEDGTAE